MTYVKGTSFGGLGHGIYDMDTGTLLKIKGGLCWIHRFIPLKKGKSGTPGEIVGSIEYKEENILGSIKKIRKKEFMEPYQRNNKSIQDRISSRYQTRESLYSLQCKRYYETI